MVFGRRFIHAVDLFGDGCGTGKDDEKVMNMKKWLIVIIVIGIIVVFLLGVVLYESFESKCNIKGPECGPKKPESDPKENCTWITNGECKTSCDESTEKVLNIGCNDVSLVCCEKIAV